jgi:predicted nucleic acid-binding protein
MNELAFFDTNVLVYADDASSPKKQDRAITLFAGHLRHGSAVVSLQVLQEYFVAATRVRFEASDIIAAIELHRLTQISLWDALIVHAARSAWAAVLYSEDLQSGAVLGGVRVVNPFVTGTGPETP